MTWFHIELIYTDDDGERFQNHLGIYWPTGYRGTVHLKVEIGIDPVTGQMSGSLRVRARPGNAHWHEDEPEVV